MDPKFFRGMEEIPRNVTNLLNNIQIPNLVNPGHSDSSSRPSASSASSSESSSESSSSSSLPFKQFFSNLIEPPRLRPTTNHFVNSQSASNASSSAPRQNKPTKTPSANEASDGIRVGQSNSSRSHDANAVLFCEICQNAEPRHKLQQCRICQIMCCVTRCYPNSQLFCDNDYILRPNSPHDWCIRCLTFTPNDDTKPNLTPSNLQRLPIRQLLWFIRDEDIEMNNAASCEKSELIGVILRYFGKSAAPPPVNQTVNNNRANLHGENITLGDIELVEEIRQLSVRQLRHLLRAHSVDDSDAIEKGDLICKVERLWLSSPSAPPSAEERTNKGPQQQTQQTAASKCGTANANSMECVICMENARDCILLKCNHVVGCFDCCIQLTECPVCRESITKCNKIYFS